MDSVIDLSIVIPAYKEERRLSPTLGSLIPYLHTQKWRFEIILVIEPSQDRTLEVAKEWEKQHAEIKIIINPWRLGKGGAVRAGLLNANGKVLAFMDADGATGFSFLEDGFARITSQETEVVIASRGLKNSIINQPQSYLRRRLGLLYRWFTKKITNLPYEDTQCGCKMFAPSTIQPLFGELLDKGFAFDVEILLKAKLHNITVKELPCIWKDIEGSTVRPVRDGLKMLRAVFYIKSYYYHRTRVHSSKTLFIAKNNVQEKSWAVPKRLN